jgi:hypothetical protein
MFADRWLSSHGKITAIFSKFTSIDEIGSSVYREYTYADPYKLNDLDYISRRFYGISGCTSAYSKTVFSIFPPFMEGICYEDRVLPTRAALVGQVCFIDAQTVKYRIGTGVSTGAKSMEIEIKRHLCQRIKVVLQKRNDFRFTGKIEGRENNFRASLAEELYQYFIRYRKNWKLIVFLIKKMGIKSFTARNIIFPLKSYIEEYLLLIIDFSKRRY